MSRRLAPGSGLRPSGARHRPRPASGRPPGAGSCFRTSFTLIAGFYLSRLGVDPGRRAGFRVRPGPDRAGPTRVVTRRSNAGHNRCPNRSGRPASMGAACGGPGPRAFARFVAGFFTGTGNFCASVLPRWWSALCWWFFLWHISPVPNFVLMSPLECGVCRGGWFRQRNQWESKLLPPHPGKRLTL